MTNINPYITILIIVALAIGIFLAFSQKNKSSSPVTRQEEGNTQHTGSSETEEGTGHIKEYLQHKKDRSGEPLSRADEEMYDADA